LLPALKISSIAIGPERGDEMKVTDFCNAIDAIELDPRPRLQACAARIVERELDGVPDELAETIASPRLEGLATKAKEVLERGHYDRIDALLTAVAIDLNRAVEWERREGSLKPHLPEDEIKKFAGALRDRRWNSHEVNCLSRLVKPGERIVSVEWRSIGTSERVIGRDDLRPVSNTVEFWRSHGTPTKTIREAEAEERAATARAARPFSADSGPNVQPGVKV
jgi:hypothetical protein